MKVITFASACCVATAVSPLQKTIQMLSDLEAKIIKEGEQVQKEYEEYAEFCEDRSRDLGFEIKTGTSQVAELKATIAKEESTAQELDSKIEGLVGDIASDEADLKAATEIREKEAADFAAEEKELVETIDMLERAIGIIEKEMAKGGASMMQLKGLKSMQQVFDTMVKASAMSSADATRLSALVQTQNDSDDSDMDVGAPEAAVYESHSDSIVDTLEGILEKAQTQLGDLQKTEVNKKNNFAMLKQSLEDEIKFATKEKDSATKALATSGENKATAEGDLAMTSKALAEDKKTLGETHQDCMTKAEEFEAGTTSRGEELKALAMAKKAIVEMASEAGASFLQVDSATRSSLTTRADLANFEAVQFVRDLARKQSSPQLAQLASRMATVLRLGSRAGSSDPFAKVKGLITDMISKLEKEAAEAADLHAWCEKETAESTQKKVEANAEVEHLSTKIDSATAHSKKLKEEVATLQKELAQLAKTQAEMDQLRAEEKAVFNEQKPELELGLKGVKLALKILNDYYSKNKSSNSGAGSGIIGMLEVVESDFTKNLAEITAAEDSAEATYQRESAENKVEKKMKEQDVKYKTKEYTGLDKSVTELTADRQGVQAELDAVLEYLESLEKKCTYKVETYAEKKARRDAEVAGLKEALEILNNEVALIQRSSHLRGVRKHL
jgi:predicted  nucleic acid-binding Zn-ribbon protein